MKNYLAFISLVVLVSTIASCTSSQKESAFDLTNARKEIETANKQFVEFFDKSDSVGLANMFTIDGKSMEPNEPSFNGRSKIQTHFSIVMNAGANKLRLLTTGLWGDENMLAEEGEYTFIDKDGKQLDKGKYIVLWKKEEGKWKLFRDCYNSNLPLATARQEDKAQLNIDPVKISPDKFKIVMENEHVRVIQYSVKPGEKDNWHTHPPKSSYVIAGGRLKVFLENGETIIADEKTGTASWMDYVGKHYVENIGGTTVTILLTEVK